jgi:hypothetical protein
LNVVARWQETYPGCNWGAALDAGTFVIDCDCDAAVSTLHDLGEVHGGIPWTLTTLTGRGFHFWFRTPEAAKVRNRVGVLPGIDVRSEGGYVVVPPSVHQSGARYTFSDLSAPIADTPRWLLELVTGSAVSTSGKANNVQALAALYAENVQNEQQAILDREPTPFEHDIASRGWESRIGRPGKVPAGRSPFSLRILLEPQTVVEGTRNAALYAYLCRLRHEGKPEESIRSEAWRVMARIPHPMSGFEVEKVITNVLEFDGNAAGNNTLMDAWRTVEEIEVAQDTSKFYRFLLLVEQLVELRPEASKTVLLPVRSIGNLMGAHFTQVAKWVRKAIEMGILKQTAHHVRRRLAAEYAVDAGFSALDDGPDHYKVKRGRPKTVRVELAKVA